MSDPNKNGLDSPDGKMSLGNSVISTEKSRGECMQILGQNSGAEILTEEQKTTVIKMIEAHGKNIMDTSKECHGERDFIDIILEQLTEQELVEIASIINQSSVLKSVNRGIALRAIFVQCVQYSLTQIELNSKTDIFLDSYVSIFTESRVIASTYALEGKRDDNSVKAMCSLFDADLMKKMLPVI